MARFREPFEFERTYQPHGRREVVADAVETELVPVLIGMDEPPRLSGSAGISLDAHFQVFRPEPLDEDLRISVSLENQLTRGVEFAFDEKFLFAGFGDDLSFVCHDIAPFFINFDPPVLVRYLIRQLRMIIYYLFSFVSVPPFSVPPPAGP